MAHILLTTGEGPYFAILEQHRYLTESWEFRDEQFS